MIDLETSLNLRLRRLPIRMGDNVDLLSDIVMVKYQASVSVESQYFLCYRFICHIQLYCVLACRSAFIVMIAIITIVLC